MNPLPPQAYTKDTLLLAYSWLMNQSSAIREMATTPDILVSLYLKATRDGDGALDRPSIQNFKTELRNLAGIMGHLDDGGTGGASIAAVSHSQSLNQAHAQNTIQVNITPPNNAFGGNFGNAFQLPPQGMQHSSGLGIATSREQSITVKQNDSPAIDWSGLFDDRTMKMIHHIQEELNLSSETEAIRLLIKLGYLKAQQFISEWIAFLEGKCAKEVLRGRESW